VGTWRYYTVEFPTTVSGVEDEFGVVSDFQLEQNYPNPFNPSTTIKYSVPEKGNVTIRVFDMLGAEVATLVNVTQEVGSYEINFDASKLSSGMYIYKLNAGTVSLSKKMMLLK
ncbi:MAG: T9SS type A sorting domain-containing protein, partial [Ignavibacteriaceae bacterium]